MLISLGICARVSGMNILKIDKLFSYDKGAIVDMPLSFTIGHMLRQ